MEKVLPTHPNNRKRYLLAKASNRIFSRIIDSIIVIGVCVVIGVLIIIGDSNGLKKANDLHDHWRYLLISLITAVCFFSYFIILPFLWNGRTLGMALLKLRIYNLIQTKSFLLNLIKREFFLWMICITANVILGVALASSNNVTTIFDAFFKFDNSQQQVITIIVQAIQMIGIIFIIFVIIHMCIFNRRRCFIDHVSDTCVIKYVDVNSKEANDALNAIKPHSSQRRYHLPGEITPEASEEIDSL